MVRVRAGEARTMSTVRVVKTKNFSVISNTIPCDKRLSWEARGLATFILTKPNGWVMRVSHLVTQGPCGKDKIWRLLGELQAAGYLTREQNHHSDGTFKWEHTLYEEPQLREEVQPHTENPCMDNPPIVNTELSSNTEPSITPPKARRYPIPFRMELNQERRGIAVKCGVVDADRVWATFKAHYQANAVPFANWEAKWQEWCLNQRPSPPSSATPPLPQRKPTKREERQYDAAALQSIKDFLHKDS